MTEIRPSAAAIQDEREKIILTRLNIFVKGLFEDGLLENDGKPIFLMLCPHRGRIENLEDAKIYRSETLQAMCGSQIG